VSVLVNPLMVMFLAGAAGLIAGRLGRRRTRAWLLTLAAVGAYLEATVPVGNWLLAPLEGRYQPVSDTPPFPAVSYVVVLGSGYAPRADTSAATALDREGVVRIVEGLRLFRQLGSAKLVVSGGAPPGHSAPALGYARLARAFGVTDTALIVTDTGLDTAGEARAIVGLLGTAPFLLVTSASHMPRAMWEMERSSARAIPAPTGQLTGRPLTLDSWLPSAAGLGRTERAVHEYVGLAALAAHISD
jgi:uncharacterized SAM-binding protein YcdF (DUF218 family)